MQDYAFKLKLTTIKKKDYGVKKDAHNEINPQQLDAVTHVQQIDNIMSFINQHDEAGLLTFLRSKTDRQVAELIESLPHDQRDIVWHMIPASCQASVLENLSDNVRTHLLENFTDEQIIKAIAKIDEAELIDIIDHASDELARVILRSVDRKDLESIEARLAYPEESAGRYMSTDWIAIRSDVTLGVVNRFLKRQDALPTHTDGLFVVDREGVYLGKLPLGILLTHHDDMLVSDAMIKDADRVSELTGSDAFAKLFEHHEVSSLAVVNEQHQLIGRITITDAIDIIRTTSEHQMMNMAGLNEDEDLFAPIIPSAKRRLFWLGINLVTAFLAAAVIGVFEQTLQQLVALAVLMPIVASMGGIAGSQTLTLAIRGLALGQISSSNLRFLAIKEIAIAVINGIVWAMVVGVIAYFWFGNLSMSIILGIAMIINQFAASVSGLSVPLILNKMGIDPALSGAVILTTVTDVIGFMSFLGLATLFLL